MNKFLQFYMVSLALKLVEAVFPSTAYPCAVCFGSRESAMTLGLNWGIFSMLVVLAGVLGAFGAFFVYLNNRARKFGPMLK